MATTRKNTKKAKPPAKRTTAKLPSTMLMSLEGDAGAGFENADRESYAIPFLVVLQTNSPQCDDDSDAYVKGAKAGALMNTATGELFDGKKGVELVPAHFARRFVEWAPRDSGGGFKGEHKQEDVDGLKPARDASGRFVLNNGNYLMDTRYHYCVMITKDGPVPVLFALSSTQIKKSRSWMTRMSGLKLVGKGGKKFTPPMFSHAYLITTVSESNDKGSWKGVNIESGRKLTDKEAVFYFAAREFKKQVQDGVVRVDRPVDEATLEDDDF
jgi:hypothetical protein